MQIILDTNFLLIPSYFKVDIITEMEMLFGKNINFSIIDKTLSELDKVSKKGLPQKTAVSIARQIIQNNNFEIIKTGFEGDVDKAIKKIFNPDTDILATQDKALKDSIIKKKGKVVILRQKKFLKVI